MPLTDAADDPNWRFDPENPPDEFTRQMLGRMSVAHLLMCADHDKSPLNESQQESFDEAYTELNNEIRDQIGTAAQVAMPKLEFTWPRADVDFKALFPKIDADLLSTRAYAALDESTKASFERIQRNLTEHLDIAQMLRVPAATLETSSTVPSGLPEKPESGGSTGTAATDGSGGRAAAEAPVLALPEVTPDKLLDDLAEDFNQWAQLGSVVELLTQINTTMRQQAEVVRRQQESAVRGLLFYVVVGLGSTLSGIATLVGLGSWEQRVWAVGLTAAVALTAWLAYRRTPRTPGVDGGA